VYWREACLKLCQPDGDLWNCHSRRKCRFSRTICSICRIVFFWLRCVFVDWGVETRAAETSTDSSVLTKLSTLALSLRWGLRSMCELIHFLYLTQLVFCEVNVYDCSKGSRSRINRTGEWPDERSERHSALIRFLGMFLVIPKSIKSGSFFGSAGQYIGRPEET